MSVVIQIVHLGGHEPIPSEVEGAYVEEYSANGWGGRGHLKTTFDLDKAKRFENFQEAWTAYTSVSTTHPLRGDGHPNRPLTAFTVTIQNLEAKETNGQTS